LTVDLDYSGNTFTTIGNTENGNANFAGIFDGNGKKISNISGSKGLFRNLKGTVKNLTVENFVSNGTSSDFNVGAIAGTTLSGAKIQNCRVTGNSVIAGNSSAALPEEHLTTRKFPAVRLIRPLKFKRSGSVTDMSAVSSV